MGYCVADILHFRGIPISHLKNPIHLLMIYSTWSFGFEETRLQNRVAIGIADLGIYETVRIWIESVSTDKAQTGLKYHYTLTYTLSCLHLPFATKLNEPTQNICIFHDRLYFHSILIN